MKKIIILLVTFFFIYPIYPKFFPIPLDRIYQVVGFTLLLLNIKDLKQLISSRFYLRYIGITFIFLVLVFLPQLWVKGPFDLYFFKRIVNVFLEIFGAYLVCWTIKWKYKSVTLGIVLKFLVLATVLQVIISFFFFLKPSAYDVYYSYLNEDVENKEFEDMLSMLEVRFIGIGSAFFSGVIKYGVAFFSVLILPYIYNGPITSNRFIYLLILLTIFIGGMLTGRTFFIAIILGLFMATLLKSKTVIAFILNNLKIVFLSIPIAIGMYFVLFNIIDGAQFERMFKYVFSLFINYFEGKGFQSSSTNEQMEMYIFPKELSTWFFGDGRMQSVHGGYYMGSDIGYVRLIFYFGLPATLFFIYLLHVYTKIFLKLSKSKQLKLYFWILFIWFLILNFKGLAFHSYYFGLILVALIFSNKKQSLKTIIYESSNTPQKR